MSSATFLTTGIDAYLSDESGVVGNAEGIAFPQDKSELYDSLRIVRENGTPLTIQGARTDFRCGAVPQGGYIINLTKMCAIEKFYFDPTTRNAHVRVQAGVTFEQLDDWLQTKATTVFTDEESAGCWELYRQWESTLYFMPNPGEATATIGGAVAAGAVGSYVLSGGGLAENIQDMEVLRTEANTMHLDGEEPRTEMVFGSAGALGVIYSLTLKLRSRPAFFYGLMSYHRDFATTEAFVNTMFSHASEVAGAQFLAADWFAPECRKVLLYAKDVLPKAEHIPLPPEGVVSLWSEFASDSEALLFELFAYALELLEAADSFADQTLAVTGGREFPLLQSMRHVITEVCNQSTSGSPPLMLDEVISGDMSAPATSVNQMLARTGIPYVLMGRAGTGHITARLLPTEKDGYTLAGQLLDSVRQSLKK